MNTSFDWIMNILVEFIRCKLFFTVWYCYYLDKLVLESTIYKLKYEIPIKLKILENMEF